MPILSPQARAKILGKGHLVYSAYAALNLATDPRAKVKFQHLNFNEYLQNLINNQQLDADLQVDNTVYKIRLVETDHQHYRVEITDQNNQPIPALATPKELDDYTTTDALALWANHTLLVNKTNPLKLALKFSDGDTTQQIGGNKIDLYSIHIRNLYQLLQNLKDPAHKPHALIEMATGSGKSCTQALWWMVLHLARVPAIFAVPNALLKESLKSEFRNVLPDAIATAADITTHDDLLLTRWPALKKRKGNLFLAIDEQHEAMNKELFSRRLQELGSSLALMFLTATPTQSVYDIISGSVPENKNETAVIQLSRAQKESLGLAQRAKNISSRAARILDRGNHTAATWGQRLVLAIAETLEPEKTSAAHNYVEEVEKTFTLRDTADFRVERNEVKLNNYRSLRHYLRWNLESPIGERALIHATSHDAVVNMTILSGEHEQKEIKMNYSRKSTVTKKDAYRKGNRVPREDIYEILQTSENLDKIHRKKYEERHQAQRRRTVLKLASTDLDLADKSPEQQKMIKTIEDTVDFSAHHHYLDHRIQHGLLEKALEYLTGYDSVKLDRKRRDNLDGLVNEVRGKLNELKLETFKDIEEQLHLNLHAWLSKQGLNTNPCLTNQVATLIATHIFLMAKEKKPGMLATLVDNWSLDKSLHRYFSRLPIKLGQDTETMAIQQAFEDYLQKHRVVYVMGNLEHSETPIQAGKPFYNLKEKTSPLKLETAQRKLSIFEQMNPFLHQFSYQPICLTYEQKEQKGRKRESAPSYAVETVDCLFKLGLMGCYVTSDKIVGFNDRNLQHVGILVDANNDILNQPSAIIQAVGRCRGLNPARRPHCIVSADYGVRLVFDLKDLEQTGTRRAYWKAKKAYHQQLINNLKLKLSEEIQFFIGKNINAEGELDSDLLQEKCITILLSAFDCLYIDNEHNFAKTRKEFIALLKNMQNQIIQNTVSIRKTYQCPTFVTIIGALSNLFAKINLYFKTRSTRAELAAALKKTAYTEPAARKTYAHIIATYNYKKVQRTQILSANLAKLMRDKTQDLALKVAAESTRYLNAEVKNPFDPNFRNKIAPILLQHVADAKHRAALLVMINRKSWLDATVKFCLEYKEQLEQLQGTQDVSLQFDLLFKPLLLQDAEIASYVKANQVVFDKNRLQKSKKHLEQEVTHSKKEAKQLQKRAKQVMAQHQTEMEKLGEACKEKIATSLEAIMVTGEKQFLSETKRYETEAKEMPVTIKKTLEKFAKQFAPSQQTGFGILKAAFKGARLALSNKNNELNEVFKKDILRDCFRPLLDRQSQAVTDRVLSDTRYDWSKSLLKNRGNPRFETANPSEKLAILIQETLQGEDKTALLTILRGLTPNTNQESKGKDKTPPPVAKAAIFERMERYLQTDLLPKLFNALFEGSDKALLFEVVNDYLKKGKFLTSPINRDLMESALNRKMGSLSEEDKLIHGRIFLKGFFLNLIPEAEIAKKQQIERIISKVPFSNLYSAFNQQLKETVFKSMATFMSQEEGPRFLMLTSKYDAWGEHLVALLKEEKAARGTVTNDPQKFIGSLIERVVSDPGDKIELQALMAANNKEGYKKKFFIQFLTRVKEDVLTFLPDHSPIKQSYTHQAPTEEAFRAGLARAYDETKDALQVLTESKGAALEKFDFIAELLGKAIPQQPTEEAKQPAALQPTMPLQELMAAIRENKDFIESLPQNLDRKQLKRLLIRQLQPLFGDDVYKNTIKDILGPLDKNHILTLLNALHPRQDNQANATLLVTYKQDLLRLSPHGLLEKYLNLNGQNADLQEQLKNSQLFLISKLTMEILTEVWTCQQYFYNSNSLEVPKLKIYKDNSYFSAQDSVWKVRTPSSESVRKSLKIRKMQGFVETYPDMNTMEALKKQDESTHSLQAAAALGRLSQDLSRRSESVGHSRFTVFANMMKQATSLTQDEVLDAETPYMSAVDRMKQAMKA